MNAEVAQSILQDAGLAVDLARDGEAAVQMAQQHAYRQVLMDMQLPRLDGLGATRAIRQHHSPAALTIIAMIANAFGEDQAQCRAEGLNDFNSNSVDPGGAVWAVAAVAGWWA